MVKIYCTKKNLSPNKAWSALRSDYTTRVDFLNSILKNDGNNSSIRASTWRNCQADPWNLFYNCITFIATINE